MIDTVIKKGLDMYAKYNDPVLVKLTFEQLLNAKSQKQFMQNDMKFAGCMSKNEYCILTIALDNIDDDYKVCI